MFRVQKYIRGDTMAGHCDSAEIIKSYPEPEGALRLASELNDSIPVRLKNWVHYEVVTRVKEE